MTLGAHSVVDDADCSCGAGVLQSIDDPRIQLFGRCGAALTDPAWHASLRRGSAAHGHEVAGA